MTLQDKCLPGAGSASLSYGTLHSNPCFYSPRGPSTEPPRDSCCTPHHFHPLWHGPVTWTHPRAGRGHPSVGLEGPRRQGEQDLGECEKAFPQFFFRTQPFSSSVLLFHLCSLLPSSFPPLLHSPPCLPRPPFLPHSSCCPLSPHPQHIQSRC